MVGGCAALGGGIGFIRAGLTGKEGWDWNRAVAGGISGAMVGAGVGLMLTGGGALLSNVLMGAGMGGWSSLQNGQTVDWSAWGAGTVIGGASGAVSGMFGWAGGRVLGWLARPGAQVLPRIANPLARIVNKPSGWQALAQGWVGQAAVGGVSSLAGNVTSQNLQIAFGMRQEFSYLEAGAAYAGGALGGAASAASTAKLFRSPGVLRCDVSQTRYIAQHVLGGAAGAAAGDVFGQYGSLLEDQAYWSGERKFDWGQLGTSTLMGAGQSYATAKGQYGTLLKACFCAGTPLRTLFGSKPIEEIKAGEWIVSRDESNPDGLLMAKQVEEVFVRTGRVWHLHVGGQLIRTTGEHPFYVKGRGWVRGAGVAAWRSARHRRWPVGASRGGLRHWRVRDGLQPAHC